MDENVKELTKKYLAEKKARLEAQMQLLQVQFNAIQKEHQQTGAELAATEVSDEVVVPTDAPTAPEAPAT